MRKSQKTVRGVACSKFLWDCLLKMNLGTQGCLIEMQGKNIENQDSTIKDEKLAKEGEKSTSDKRAEHG